MQREGRRFDPCQLHVFFVLNFVIFNLQYPFFEIVSSVVKSESLSVIIDKALVKLCRAYSGCLGI